MRFCMYSDDRHIAHPSCMSVCLNTCLFCSATKPSTRHERVVVGCSLRWGKPVYIVWSQNTSHRIKFPRRASHTCSTLQKHLVVNFLSFPMSPVGGKYFLRGTFKKVAAQEEAEHAAVLLASSEVPWCPSVIRLIRAACCRLLITMAIAELAVLMGAMDQIAAVVDFFFLMCYASINVTCAMHSIVKAPNWRPRYKYYHWSCLFLFCLTSGISLLHDYGTAKPLGFSAPLSTPQRPLFCTRIEPNDLVADILSLRGLVQGGIRLTVSRSTYGPVRYSGLGTMYWIYITELQVGSFAWRIPVLFHHVHNTLGLRDHFMSSVRFPLQIHRVQRVFLDVLFLTLNDFWFCLAFTTKLLLANSGCSSNFLPTVALSIIRWPIFSVTLDTDVRGYIQFITMNKNIQ